MPWSMPAAPSGSAGSIRPGVPAFEYRHAPDPHEIDDVLLPALEELRSGGTLPSKASAAG